jgi:hypothetical protein
MLFQGEDPLDLNCCCAQSFVLVLWIAALLTPLSLSSFAYVMACITLLQVRRRYSQMACQRFLLLEYCGMHHLKYINLAANNLSWCLILRLVMLLLVWIGSQSMILASAPVSGV